MRHSKQRSLLHQQLSKAKLDRRGEAEAREASVKAEEWSLLYGMLCVWKLCKSKDPHVLPNCIDLRQSCCELGLNIHTEANAPAWSSPCTDACYLRWRGPCAWPGWQIPRQYVYLCSALRQRLLLSAIDRGAEPFIAWLMC